MSYFVYCEVKFLINFDPYQLLVFRISHFFSCFVLYIRRRKREKKCVGGNRRGKKEMGRLFLCISIPKRSIDLLAVESLVFEPFHANKSRGRRQTFLRGYLIPRLAIDRWFAPIRDKKRILMIVGAWVDDTWTVTRNCFDELRFFFFWNGDF